MMMMLLSLIFFSVLAFCVGEVGLSDSCQDVATGDFEGDVYDPSSPKVLCCLV